MAPSLNAPPPRQSTKQVSEVHPVVLGVGRYDRKGPTRERRGIRISINVRIRIRTRTTLSGSNVVLGGWALPIDVLPIPAGNTLHSLPLFCLVVRLVLAVAKIVHGPLPRAIPILDQTPLFSIICHQPSPHLDIDIRFGEYQLVHLDPLPIRLFTAIGHY